MDRNINRQPDCMTDAAGWISLLAAPTFMMMALLTSSSGGEPAVCSASHGGLALGGMTPMYVLMSAFHLAPWLKLISGRSRAATREGKLV
jgi:hypothetical protein